MADSPAPLRIASDIGGAIGLLGLMVAGVLYLLALPLYAVLVVASVSFGALCVGVLGHVFFSQSVEYNTIGEWKQGYVPLGRPNASPALAVEVSRDVLKHEIVEIEKRLLAEIESKYDLTKRKHNFMEHSPKVLFAHDDPNRVIVRAGASDDGSFQCVVKPFSNEKTSGRVASIARVSFGLTYQEGTSGNPVPPLTIHRGAWFGERDIELDFPANCPPRRAIIATIENDQVSAISRDSDSAYRGIEFGRERLAADIYKVRLNLLANSEPTGSSFDYVLEITRNPVIKLHLERAVLWKSKRLGEFVDESFGLSDRIHEIWKDANNKAPLPPAQPAKYPNLLAAALNSQKEEPPPFLDFFEATRSRDAIQRAGEETLIPTLEDWRSRAGVFLGLWFGKEQAESFIKAKPTFDDGLNCIPRRKGWYGIISPQGQKPADEPAQWSLRDAVAVRRDILMALMRNLK